MKHSPYNISGAQWRALVLPVILGLALVVVLMGRLLPAYSDDGPGDEETAFDSPLLIWKYPSGDETLLHAAESTAGDLLTNGDMDQMGFYWRYPNHWIAGGWFEWFATTVGGIPEFDDGHRRGFAHTPPSSQRLQLWGVTYAGGLLQSPSVQPCTYYQLQAYGQSRPGSDDPPPVKVASHMKVGIEPYGWLSGRTIPRYDPGLEPDEFPPTVVWSPESDQDFVWVPYSVTTEALSDTITAILYSNPQVDYEGGVIWNDAIWDTASLVEVPTPSGTLLDSDYLPVPDGFITSLNVQALPTVSIIEWDTPEAASSQVLYRVLDPTTPITATEPLTYPVYMPLVVRATDPLETMQRSPVYGAPVQHHTIVLTGLPDDYVIELVGLSRRLEDAGCVTSASDVISTESAGEPLLSLFLPAVVRGD
jgi:hypothetical protein